MEKLRRGDMLDDTEGRVAALAAAQHGVIARRQALDCGMTDTMIRRRVTSGRWVLLWPGVYSPAAVSPSWRRLLVGACLAGGANTVASHRAAGALWSFDGRPPGIVEVTVHGSGVRHYQGVILHRTRALPTVDRGTVEGIPVTRPARTLIDLAAVLDPDSLEMALDSALRNKLVTVSYLHRRMATLGPRGRDGVATLQQLVADRRDGKAAGSQAENRLRRQLVEAGLPPAVRQYVLRDHLGLAAIFDLAFPDARIGIEYDSERHHSGERARRRDMARHNRVTAQGWLLFHLPAGADVTPVVLAYRNRPAA